MTSTSSFISTASLESKLRQLKQQSLAISEHLTSSLSTSASGQILLQLAKTLDSNHLVPDAHEVVVNECLIPLRENVKEFNESYSKEWSDLYDMVMDLRIKARRFDTVQLAREKYMELEAAEDIINNIPSSLQNVENIDELCLSIERVAFISLDLSEELKRSTAIAATSLALSSNVQKRSIQLKQENLKSKCTSLLPLNLLNENLPPNNERAQFFMKLASRIRRLESDLTQLLIQVFSSLLKLIENETHICDDGLFASVSHCLRSFAIIGRGKDAESTFARVSIMPLIRSKLSVGRIDEGGPRGQCAGLFSLLDDITHTILSRYGTLIHTASELFYSESNCPDIDLVVGGVWVPIATALMGDSTVKMAIFSPGVANVIQANFIALDTFISELADRLLASMETSSFLPPDFVNKIQVRIMLHPITKEFNKKWNLPIYYQLRFGESCKRLDEAINKVESEGWYSSVFTNDKHTEDSILRLGYNLPFFVELYDILSSFWKEDVVLKPLSHRFLRGTLQFLNRVLDMIQNGLDKHHEDASFVSSQNGQHKSNKFNSWVDRVDDIATVAWNLNILRSTLLDQYTDHILSVITPSVNEGRRNIFSANEDIEALRQNVLDIVQQAASDLTPLIESGWKMVVSLLVDRCSAPLSAVKGVAATYRMTNRPAPTLASPYVSTILRPINEFLSEFSDKIPSLVQSGWKEDIIRMVANKYRISVEELITTVKQTEEALRKRKSKRATSQGMSDGEKVMAQIRLDIEEFRKYVLQSDIDVTLMEDIAVMEQLAKYEFD